LLNRNNSSLTESYDFSEIISDDAYDYYGKHFAIYSDNGTQKIYISSNHKDNLPKIHQIDEVTLCSHFQKFDESSNTCIDLPSGYFSHGIQNETALACNSFNETKDFNRLLGETFWDFGCSSKQFGQQCQAWSAYKDRIGVSVSPGYKWDDSQNDVCKEIQDTANQMPWTSITSCRKCYYTEGCTYSYGDCKPSSSTVVPSLLFIHSICNYLTSEKQNTTLWGESELNYSNFDSVLSLKPNITTPRFTMCYYKLNYPEKFRGNVTFERDSNTYISIRRSKNGVFTDLSSIGRRILEGVQRNLATTDVYEILDADFIEIYYGANAELSTSIFTMTFDHTNYFQGATQTSTTSRSKPWKILVIVVSIVIFIIVIGIIIAVPSIIWMKRRRDRISIEQTQEMQENQRMQGILVPNESYEDQIEPIPEIRERLDRMAIKFYEWDLDRYNTKMWAFCLNDFKQGDTVRIIKNCKHVFDFEWIEKMVSHKYNQLQERGLEHKDRYYICPLCKKAI
jgi:hypothetical protein